ncbi:MAG TPA: cupin domain-containing protein [Blastocatellia bacterium]|nr:cupin domain-containing protein [Blastocatellia bacterium]
MKDNLTADQIREYAALYALGALPEEEAREFERLLAAGDKLCKDELKAFQQVAGKVGIGAEPQAPPPELRARLLAELREEKQERAEKLTSLTIRHDEGRWKECGKGVFVKHLFTDKSRGTVTALYKLMPGARLPDHGHLGVEECLVLEGDFYAGGEVYGPGDYRCVMPGSLDLDLYTVSGTLLLIIGPEKYEMLEPPS